MAVPEAANPKFQVKMKLIRQIGRLPADRIVMDLGAGVHYNTLDFFNAASVPVIVTQPEPGAVMNAYGFLKSALLRKIQRVFRQEREIARNLAETTLDERERRPSLEILENVVKSRNLELAGLLHEIKNDFSPGLILNRSSSEGMHILVRNLQGLCRQKLGISLRYLGNLPDLPSITSYMINIPAFLQTDAGCNLRLAVEKAIGLLLDRTAEPGEADGIIFDDSDLEELIRVIDGLDDSVLERSRKELLKLRVFFRPSEVVSMLLEMGVAVDLPVS